MTTPCAGLRRGLGSTAGFPDAGVVPFQRFYHRLSGSTIGARPLHRIGLFFVQSIRLGTQRIDLVEHSF